MPLNPSRSGTHQIIRLLVPSTETKQGPQGGDAAGNNAKGGFHDAPKPGAAAEWWRSDYAIC
jgi:hypothetical protein